MNEDKYVTAEEAAALLGVSVATVKRRCRSGEIAAEKVGRGWLVVASGLPASRRTPPRARTSSNPARLVDFEASIRHLKGQDIRRDLWVPDVLRHEDDFANRESLVDQAAARVDRMTPPDPATQIPVPKSPIFLRNAVNLSLVDRLAYHAVVLACAPTLDSQIGSQAYAARFKGRARFVGSGTTAWRKWKADVQERARKLGGYVIETDITAFFDCVSHAILLREMEDVGVPQELVSSLREMLRVWAVAPNTGLPQGPDASRLLANFYMHQVDDVLTALPGVAYFRYMDDVRIVAAERHIAIAALRVLDTECKRRNLVLSTKKTALLTAQEAIDSLDDALLDSANYAYEDLTDGPKARAKLVEVFRAALKRDGSIDTKRMRFSLFRLRALRERSVLNLVLDRLESLVGMGWLVPSYILPWLSKRRVADAVASFLEDPERNTAEYLSCWLLAGFADEPRGITPRILRYARAVAYDPSAASFHRVIAMQVAAVGGTANDETRLKDIISREYHPEIVRGALVALRRIAKLDRATASRATRIPGMASTVEFLRQRHDLPSLLFGEQRVPLRLN